MPDKLENTFQLLPKKLIVYKRAHSVAWQCRYKIGNRWFDIERAELRGPDGIIRLTGGEAALMQALARRAGEILSREDIGEALGTPDAGERAIDVQVTRLRRKVEPDPREPRFIQTIRHRGYVLRPGP
jgi:two-component system phosphate regulon response regulator OmpR